MAAEELPKSISEKLLHEFTFGSYVYAVVTAPLAFFVGAAAGIPVGLTTCAGQMIRFATLLWCIFELFLVALLASAAIVLSVFCLFAGAIRIFNWSLPQMLCHGFAAAVSCLIGCWIAAVLTLCGIMVELADRLPMAIAGFVVGCLAITMSVCCCKDQIEMFQKANELVTSRMTGTCDCQPPGPALISVAFYCLFNRFASFFSVHASAHGAALGLKLDYRDGSQEALRSFFAKQGDVCLFEKHWPTGMCAHHCYCTAIIFGGNICQSVLSWIRAQLQRIEKLFLSGFFYVPLALMVPGHQCSLRILRMFGYGDLNFWRQAEPVDLRVGTLVLHRGGMAEVLSVTGDLATLSNESQVAVADVCVQAGEKDPDGPLATYRRTHVWLSRAFGVAGATFCIVIFAFDHVITAVSAAGCDKWVLSAMSRIANVVAFVVVMFGVCGACFMWAGEALLRVAGTCFAFAAQLTAAVLLSVGKPFVCLFLIVAQFMCGCFLVVASVFGSLALFLLLHASAIAALVLGHALAVVAAALGLIYGTPFVGTLMKALVACASCGEAGGKLEEWGCTAMMKHANANFTFWRSWSHTNMEQLQECANGVFPGGCMEGVQVGCKLLRDYSTLTQCAADFALAKSIFLSTFGGEGCWWRATWVVQCCAHLLVPYMFGFALGCLRRIWDAGWKCEERAKMCDSQNPWPCCKPHGGMCYVEQSSSTYSHRVAVVRSGGRLHNILRDPHPCNGSELLVVVGRPIWDPSGVFVATPGVTWVLPVSVPEPQRKTGWRQMMPSRPHFDGVVARSWRPGSSSTGTSATAAGPVDVENPSGAESDTSAEILSGEDSDATVAMERMECPKDDPPQPGLLGKPVSIKVAEE